MSLCEQHSAVSSVCESLLLLVTWKNEKNCKQLKVKEDRDWKGLKNWFHLACPVSTMGARNRGYCVGSVQLLGSVTGQVPQFMKGSEGKTFKQLDRVQLFPPPRSPQPGYKPSVIIHRLCGLGIETEWKGNKRRPLLMLCLFLFRCQSFQGNFN